MNNQYSTLTEAFKANISDQLSVTFIEGTNEESVLTYKQLHEKAMQFLHCLQARGLQPGDELIFFLNDNQTFIIAFWACIFGGIIPVPIAVGISDEHKSKLFRIFARLQKPYLLIDRKAADLLQAYATRQQLQADYAAIVLNMLVTDEISLSGQLGEEYIPDDDQLAFIQFSSGSTRDPKGVCLTHRNLITTVTDLGNRAEYTADDISLSWMPLTHDLGLIGFHINMIVFGMQQHIMATDLFSRRPLLWLQKASEKRASVLSSPNFGFKHYLKMYANREQHELDLSCIRIILNGAEPISVGLCHQFLETLSQHGLKRSSIYTVYGLAEAALAVSLPIPGSEFEYIEVDRNTVNFGQQVDYAPASEQQTIRFAVEGPIVEQSSLRIADEQGVDYGEDRVGEIQIKGPNVSSGYYNDSEANKALFTPDGWMRTGDLGLLYKGQLVVIGRLKDIIFANGQNYYPHDLEAIILNDNSALELGKIAALGVRKNDSDHDEVLVCIVFRGDLADFIPLVQHVKQSINTQIGLEISYVIPVQRIPKTTSGKVQRRFFADNYLAGEYTKIIAEIDAALTIETDKADTTATQSATAQAIESACKAALPDKTIALQDNFFEIGLSSLDLAQMHEKIDELYPGVLDIVDMFDYSTVEALAAFIDEKTTTNP